MVGSSRGGVARSPNGRNRCVATSDFITLPLTNDLWDRAGLERVEQPAELLAVVQRFGELVGRERLAEARLDPVRDLDQRERSHMRDPSVWERAAHSR